MKTLNPKIEQYRYKVGKLASDSSYGNNGFFVIPFKNDQLRVIASDSRGWDHVSVSCSDRCPTWEEMCFVKDLFFTEEETVIQYHPPKSVYINYHPFVLHLWRSHEYNVPLPPRELIAPV